MEQINENMKSLKNKLTKKKDPQFIELLEQCNRTFCFINANDDEQSNNWSITAESTGYDVSKVIKLIIDKGLNVECIDFLYNIKMGYEKREIIEL